VYRQIRRAIAGKCALKIVMKHVQMGTVIQMEGKIYDTSLAKKPSQWIKMYISITSRYLTLLGLPLSHHNMSVLFYDDLINAASQHKRGISQKMAVYAVHTTTCVSKQKMVSLVCAEVSMFFPVKMEQMKVSV
jgi:hypothetical protein